MAVDWPHETGTIDGRRDIVLWWEARRFRFNLWLVAAGIATWILVLVAGSAAVEPGVDFEEPVFMIMGSFGFWIIANVCYTAVWIVDLILSLDKGRERAFKMFLIFWMTVAVLPGLWAVVAFIITLITGKKLDE